MNANRERRKSEFKKAVRAAEGRGRRTDTTKKIRKEKKEKKLNERRRIPEFDRRRVEECLLKHQTTAYNVDEILKFYRGKEVQMFVAMTTGYQVNPTRPWLEMIFTTYDPESLPEVDRILAEYKDRENALYLKLKRNNGIYNPVSSNNYTEFRHSSPARDEDDDDDDDDDDRAAEATATKASEAAATKAEEAATANAEAVATEARRRHDEEEATAAEARRHDEEAVAAEARRRHDEEEATAAEARRHDEEAVAAEARRRHDEEEATAAEARRHDEEEATAAAAAAAANVTDDEAEAEAAAATKAKAKADKQEERVRAVNVVLNNCGNFLCVLEINEMEDKNHIASKFRRKSKLVHPDKHTGLDGHPKATEAMQILNKAYDTLKDLSTVQLRDYFSMQQQKQQQQQAAEAAATKAAEAAAKAKEAKKKPAKKSKPTAKKSKPTAKKSKPTAKKSKPTKRPKPAKPPSPAPTADARAKAQAHNASKGLRDTGIYSVGVTAKGPCPSCCRNCGEHFCKTKHRAFIYMKL